MRMLMRDDDFQHRVMNTAVEQCDLIPTET